MDQYFKKIRHILPAFLIIAFGSLAGISILRWILCTQYPILDIKEEVWTVWIPLIFPWIPIIIWLRPRFRVLIFKKETDNRRFLFQLISWMTLVAMLSMAQAYFTTATGKLQELNRISEIEQVKKSRFYKIKHFAVAPYYSGAYTDFRIFGKYNRDLSFDVFFVIPIMNDTSERVSRDPKYWYGVKYCNQISNKISNEEKEQLYKAFYRGCIQKMKSYNYFSLDHFERKPNSDDYQNYLKAINTRTKLKANKNYIVLVPVNDRYEKRNGNKLAWTFGSFGIGVTILLLLLTWPGFSEYELKKFMSGKM